MRYFLLLTGWALFAVSLALPAITFGGFMLSGTYKGWVCLVISVPCIAAAFTGGGPKGVYVSLIGLSNLLMLASPALALWGARWAAAQRLAFLAAFVVVSAYKLLDDGPGTAYHLGYYFWCLSFAAVAAALHFKQ